MSFDPIFYRKIYPDLRFIPDDKSLYNHWNNSGKKENRICSESQLRQFISTLPYSFDIKVYQRYPDVPNNELDCLVHFYMHGYKEKRIYNATQLAFTDNELEDQIQDELSHSKDYISSNDLSDKKINILIRTHNRDKMFGKCITSVLTQTYENVHIYVCIQHPDDILYVNKHISGNEKVTIITGKPGPESYNHNNFCNQLIDMVTTGWIVFLDDDDMFTTPNALSIIASHIERDRIVLWKYKRPDTLIYPDIKNKLDTPGTIASPSYCIHHNVARYSTWPTQRQGDFYFIQPIFNSIQNKQFIDLPLTKFQLNSKIASFTE